MQFLAARNIVSMFHENSWSDHVVVLLLYSHIGRIVDKLYVMENQLPIDTLICFSVVQNLIKWLRIKVLHSFPAVEPNVYCKHLHTVNFSLHCPLLCYEDSCYDIIFPAKTMTISCRKGQILGGFCPSEHVAPKPCLNHSNIKFPNAQVVFVCGYICIYSTMIYIFLYN